jgi:hypothetical protein
MNITHIKNYDAINQLPTDENPVSENEMKILNMLFKEKEKPKSKTSKDIFETIVVGFLFVLLSLPCFDSLLFQIENTNIILLIKTVLIMFLFWIIRYVELKKFFM